MEGGKKLYLLVITNCGIYNDGEMNFSLIVLEVEGALERESELALMCVSIGGKCKTIQERPGISVHPYHRA